MPLAAGQTLSYYEILGPLGVGAMGEVYRAKDTRLDREVAIKVLPEHFAEDEERLRRFEREAKSLASLNHPNVAQIYGVDQVEDTCFLVLELVPGETLEDRIARGPLPPDETIDVCRQIAEGLEAAHEAGVIHRDLKPANVRITPEGKVKVLDFGLAKPTGPDAGTVSTSDSVLATEEGRLLGTPTYMAPEQARGKSIDRRVDVWAFGCVLYECLTAERAFAGETISDVLAAVLQEEPDLKRLPAGTPHDVRQLVARCLEKDPRMRQRDMGDAWLELTGSLAAGSAQLSGQAADARGQRLAFAGIVGALAVGAFLGFTLRGGHQEKPPEVSRLALPQEADRLWRGSRDSSMSFGISPDDKSLVYVGEIPRNERENDQVLVLRRLRTKETITLSNLGVGVSDPCFSPDGSWIGFALASELKKVAVADGVSQTICKLPGDADEAGDCRGVVWLPDDRIVFGMEGDGLYSVPAAGGTPDRLTTLMEGEWEHCWPEPVPGSQALLFTIRGEGGAAVALLAPGAQRHSVLLEGAHCARYLSPGYLVYARGTELFADTFDPDTSSLGRQPVPLAERVNGSKWTGNGNFCLSQKGTLAYATPRAPTPRGRSLVWLDRDGNTSPSEFEPRAYKRLAISSSGRLVVELEDGGMWIGDTNRQTLKPLSGATGRMPVWEGENLVLISGSEDNPTLLRRSIAGEELDEVPLRSMYLPSAATLDGNRILVSTQGGSTGWGLWLASFDGDLTPLVTEPGYQMSGAISADGEWLAFGSQYRDRNELFVTPFPNVSSDRIRVPGGLGEATWSRDGTELFFKGEDGLMSVSVSTTPTLSIGDPQLIYSGPVVQGIGREYDVMPDGQRFLMIQEDPLAPKNDREEIHVVVNWIEELRAMFEARD